MAEKIYRDKNDHFELPPIPKSVLRHFKWLAFKDRYLLNDPLSRLKHIYKFIDTYNRFVSTFAVCKKGCNYCCNVDVYITFLEAYYISLNTGIEIDHGKSLTQGHQKPCPFLDKDGECAIYLYRPFNCRAFHTVDNPKYCKSGEAHITYGSAGIGYGSAILSNCAKVIDHINKGRPKRDIRDFFQTTYAL